MTEQFRINGSFGNGTAVHSNVLSMLPPAVLVNDLRETLLTHTAFASNQYRQVGRSHLNSHIYRTHQYIIVTYDAKT